MKLVCCVCGLHVQGDKDDKEISHTYCNTCYQIELEKIKKLKERRAKK